MNNFIEIHWTTGSIDEARKVARYLVHERLVANAKIIPWLESISMWNNQLNTSQETKVIFQTQQQKFESIKTIIEKNTNFAIPEILIFKIESINSEYNNWLEESLAITN